MKEQKYKNENISADIIKKIEDGLQIPFSDSYVGLHSIGDDFAYQILGNVDLDYESYCKQKDLVQYYIDGWFCTDTPVGCLVYLFFGKVVAFSWQRGRKADLNIKWMDRKAYKQVKKYLQQFVLPDNEDEIDLLSYDDAGYIEQTIVEGVYSLKCYNELDHRHAVAYINKNAEGYMGFSKILEREKVFIRFGKESIPNMEEYKKEPWSYSKVRVFKEDGTPIICEVRDLAFHWLRKD